MEVIRSQSITDHVYEIMVKTKLIKTKYWENSFSAQADPASIAGTSLSLGWQAPLLGNLDQKLCPFRLFFLTEVVRTVASLEEIASYNVALKADITLVCSWAFYEKVMSNTDYKIATALGTTPAATMIAISNINWLVVTQ